MENSEELFNLLSMRAKVLVGTLLKRLEILEKEQPFDALLYRQLIREHIYEEFRNIKTIISIGKLEFRTKDPQK